MYKLVWRSHINFAEEELESGIETRKEAEFLYQEYLFAFGFAGSIFIRKEREKKNGK